MRSLEEIIKDNEARDIPTRMEINTDPISWNISKGVHSLETDFINHFENMATAVHRIAKEKGWWDNERNSGELIALIHSELSECLEALRLGNPPDDKIPDYTGAEAELADVIIRIMDLSAARGWCVGEAIIAKMRFNERREYKHGKRF